MVRAMRLPADYHMHTPLCRHAKGEPVDYAAYAQSLGLQEIGFSDHSPMREDGFDDWRMLSSELGDYVTKVELAKARFPKLSIKLGLEVDYLPGHEGWIRELAAMHPWDYFIGSVHYIGKWNFDHPKTIPEWRERNTFEVWKAYFDRLTMAAESGLFDIIGHADLCKKFCFYPEQDATELYRNFMSAAAEAGAAIELNTAGLRKDCKEIYPALPLLKLAAEHQVPITFGSDAHSPQEVGADFQNALGHARAAGHTESVTLTRRRKETVPLP